MHNQLMQRASEKPVGYAQQSLRTLAEIAKPIERPLHDGERAAHVAGGLKELNSRRIEMPYAPLPSAKDSSGFQMYDVATSPYDISGCTLFGNGNVLCDGALYVGEFRSAMTDWPAAGFWAMTPMDIGFYDYNYNDNSCVYELPNSASTLDDDSYFYFISNFGHINFGHFIHDTLAQLIAYDYLCKKLSRRLVPLLIGPLRYQMQTYLLRALTGEGPVYFLPRSSAVHVKKCYAASAAMPSVENGKVSVGAFRYLRERILSLPTSALAQSQIPSKAILISRADSPKSGRSFWNLNEAEKLAAGKGFASVTVGALAPEDILVTFRQCDRLLGIHGAGMLNMIFSTQDLKVVELIDYPDSWRSIEIVAWACGFSYERLKALPPQQEHGPLPGVDIAALSAALSG